jgi:hypothetical protein
MIGNGLVIPPNKSVDSFLNADFLVWVPSSNLFKSSFHQ